MQDHGMVDIAALAATPMEAAEDGRMADSLGWFWRRRPLRGAGRRKSSSLLQPAKASAAVR
eukprot:14349292-Alexandrium_andersonii.AAC.1